MTKSQQNQLDRILNAGYIVDQITENKYFVAIQFENGKDHFLLKEEYMVFIGPRGGVKFASAYRIGADKEHEKVLANLTSHEIWNKEANWS